MIYHTSRQASMSWDFWSRLHEQFRHADHRAWVAKAGDTDDEMEGIYPPEVQQNTRAA